MASYESSGSGRTQFWIWLATVIFFAGIAYSSFATKEYVQTQDEKARAELKEQLREMKETLLRIESKLDNKQDKQHLQ